MPKRPTHPVRVVVECRCGHRHNLCLPVEWARGVPHQLRCEASEPPGWTISTASGGGCKLPPDLEDLVRHQLQDNLEECRRRGFVLVRP